MNNRQAGMTLVEVIIASILLAWLSLGMFSLYSSTQKIMQKTNRVQYALFLTRERVEQLTGFGFAGYAGYPKRTSDLAVFDPNFFYTPAAPFLITEQKADVLSALSSQGIAANDFINKYLVRRETIIWNSDDWNPDGTVDYRKIEVNVIWNEPAGT